MARKTRTPDLSLGALEAARETVPERNHANRLADGWKNSKVQRKLSRRGTAVIRRNKQRRIKAGIAAKHPPKKFRGKAGPKSGLLGQGPALLADWPDGVTTVNAVRETRAFFCERFSLATLQDGGLTILVKRGWLEVVEKTRIDKTLNPVTTARRSGPWRYRLTEEGRAARSWVLWAVARHVAGWPLPVMGTGGCQVWRWLRGEPIEARPMLRHKSEAPGSIWGYLPGQVPDETWPDFGRFRLAERPPERR